MENKRATYILVWLLEVREVRCKVIEYSHLTDYSGRWLLRMEWRPAGWSVCLPLLIFPCTIKSRSSLLAPAHPGGPGRRA